MTAETEADEIRTAHEAQNATIQARISLFATWTPRAEMGADRNMYLVDGDTRTLLGVGTRGLVREPEFVDGMFAGGRIDPDFGATWLDMLGRALDHVMPARIEQVQAASEAELQRLGFEASRLLAQFGDILSYGVGKPRRLTAALQALSVGLAIQAVCMGAARWRDRTWTVEALEAAA